MSYDPADSLRRARVPVMALTGDKDVQVDPADVERMGHLVPTPFTGHVVADLTHLLRTDDGPASVRRYKQQMRRPMAPVVGELIIEAARGWIHDRDRDRDRASNGPK